MAMRGWRLLDPSLSGTKTLHTPFSMGSQYDEPGIRRQKYGSFYTYYNTLSSIEYSLS